MRSRIPLWKITPALRPYQTNFLFGTVHLNDIKQTSIHPKVKQAIQSSTHVYTEVDDTDVANVIKDNENSNCPLRKDFADRIPYASLRNLNYLANSSRISTFQYFLKHRKPWQTIMYVTWLPYLIYCELNPDLVYKDHLDHRVRQLAREYNLPVGGLETHAEVEKVLESFSTEEYLTWFDTVANKVFLSQTSDEHPAQETLSLYQLGKLKSWNERAVKARWLKDGSSSDFAKKFYEKLVIERNRLWFPRMESQVQDGKNNFWAVGIAHLPHLLQLFGKKGYQITRENINTDIHNRCL